MTDRRLSFDQVVDFLSRKADEDKEREMPRTGRPNKTFEELKEEFDARELWFVPHPVNGEPMHCRVSGRTLIQNPAQDRELHEIGRRYLNNGGKYVSSRMKNRLGLHSTMSGSILDGELPDVGMAREVEQETGIQKVDPSELKLMYPMATMEGPKRSSVWDHIWSLKLTYWFLYQSVIFPCDESRWLRDGSTEIRVRSHQLIPVTTYNYLRQAP